MNSIQLNQSAGHHRALKRFTQAVPRISENFGSIIQESLSSHLKRSRVINGDSSNEVMNHVYTDLFPNEGWIEVSAYPLAETLVGQVNFHSFFGDSCGETQ